MEKMTPQDFERLTRTMPFPKKGRERLFRAKTIGLITALIAVGVFVLPVASVIGADFESTIAFGFSMFLYWITSFIGQLLIILVGVLIYIAQYNGFVDSAAVTNGWTIVRDIANMFFIISLLLIAFGTMLGLGSNYDYKNALPRFVMMAILVNFSRTICGLIIDFSQIVMLTFVNGFKEAAGGNFINAFSISQLMQMDGGGGDINNFNWSILMSFFLALVFVGIASFVIIVMITVLVVRIVYLWLLIVLSPLAFLSSTVPVSKAKGFYSEWWDKFNNQVLVGPFLAFFLWLSLVSVAGGGIAEDGFPQGDESSESANISSSGGFQNIGVDGIQQFIIAIGLMLGGLSMAQQMSGTAVSMGKTIAKGAGRMAMRSGKFAGRMAGRGAAGVYKGTGMEAAVDKRREASLSRMGTGMMGRVPLAGAMFRKAAAKQRMAIEQKAAVDTDYQGYMSADELKAEAKRPALSHQARGRQKNALKMLMERQSSDGNVMNKEEFQGARSRLDSLGNLTHDSRSTFDSYRKVEQQHPSWIVDDNADAETKSKQLERYDKTVGKMSAKDVGALEGSEVNERLISKLDAKVVKDAMKSGTSSFMQGLAAMGIDRNLSESQIATKQEEIKNARKTQDFEYQSQADQSAIIQDIPKEQLRDDIGIDKLATVSPALIADPDNAKKVSEAFSNSELRNLPEHLRQAFVQGIKDVDTQKYVAMGGDVNDLFQKLNTNRGEFSDNAERDKYIDMVSEAHDTGGEKSGFIDPKMFAANNGLNDVAVTVTARINEADISQMAKDGDWEKVRAALQAAEGLANASAIDVENTISSRSEQMKASGASDADIEKFETDFRAMADLAKENAQKLMASVNNSGPMRAELSGMTFQGQAAQKIAESMTKGAEKLKGAATTVSEKFSEGSGALRSAVDKAGSISPSGEYGQFKRRFTRG
jgi:hypothetical protein